MAKERERRMAKELYMQGKTAKEVARLVGVTEKTVSRWVAKYNWKTLRDAKIYSAKSKVDNIKQILADLAEETVAINREIEKETDKEKLIDLRKRRNQLADEAAKWNKALEKLDNQNQVSLSTYIAIMEEIFNALKVYDEKLFYQTLDFQEKHLNIKAKQYQ